MANEAYTRTNQALAFARLALASWEAANASTALDAITMGRYHREHALFHVYRATQALIFEVSGRYGLAPWGVSAVEDVLNAISDGQSLNPELGELALQKDDSTGWLSGMLVAWREMYAPPGTAASDGASAGALIASTAGSGGEWGLVEARRAIDMLSTLLDRYRESMREW